MPSGPACMSTRSDCAKTASPMATPSFPARALPLTTSSQVSRSASRRNTEPGANSIRSNAKCGVGYQKRPFVREALRFQAYVGRPRVCHSDGVCNVKIALAAEIEHAERCIAALLDLRNDETCADRVDRTGGNENNITRQHRPPRDKTRDRAVVDGLAQLPGSELLLQAEGDLGSGCSTQDVPGFGLATCQPHRLRVRIVRMNLNGKRLAREQQLEQERGI